MQEKDFEGTLVLEKLGAIGEVDAFYDAIDSDNFKQAKRLMLKAGVDAEMIQIVLKKMEDAGSEP